MRTLHGIDDLRGLQAGEELGVSEWLEVTQEMIDLFAEATGDHQWIHVDQERAKDGPFGTTIAHGYLTLSLVPQLSHSIWTVEDVTMLVNYGADKLRFLSPVPSGGRVRARIEFQKLDEGGSGARLYNQITVELEGSEKPACLIEQIVLVVP